MLFETELRIQFVHGCIVELISIISYDISSYPITVYDVCLNEVYNYFFRDVF
jgi:hypothetical protein